MTKIATKAINKYNEWVAEDRIHKTWTHEDYDDVTVYEDVNGNIICIERNAKGTIVDAWTE